MVEKNIHWNTKRKTLYTTDKNGTEDHFCQLTYLQGHWIIENNTKNTRSHTAMAVTTSSPVTSRSPRKPKAGTTAWWHQKMGHPNENVIKHLPQSTIDCEVVDSPSDTNISDTQVYETCMLSKASKIISRRSTREHEASRPL